MNQMVNTCQSFAHLFRFRQRNSKRKLAQYSITFVSGKIVLLESESESEMGEWMEKNQKNKQTNINGFSGRQGGGIKTQQQQKNTVFYI